MKRVLITNDDGIDSPGLRALCDFASTLGEVTVCAPKREQSGKSHSIDIHNRFEIVKREYEGALAAYSVDSTPADCVRFAFDTLGPFDLVLSGVNNGVNVGWDIAYSGTCGAVFESYFFSTPAVAFSVFPSSFSAFSDHIRAIWEFFGKKRLLEKNLLWNVNIPDGAETMRITRQGGPYYQDWFRTDDGRMYYEVGHSVYKSSPSCLGYDTDAVLRDRTISITPLEGGVTEKRVYEEMKESGM